MSLYSGNGKRVAGRDRARPARGGKRLKPRSRGPRVLGGLLALLLLAGGLTLAVWYLPAVPGTGSAQTLPPTAQTGPDSSPSPSPDVPASATLPGAAEPSPTLSEPAEQPEDGRFVLSFAGDCTLGTEHDRWGSSGSFPDVVGEDYAYPLSGVQTLFASDDFTFVNLEGVLTDYNVPAEKLFRFRGPPAYGQILALGSVEGVTLANNHTLDYGKTGLADTRKTLEALGIAAAGDGETFLFTTERGLKVGVYAAYHISRAGIQTGIAHLQEQGAEVIIAAFHSGTENSYVPTDNQRAFFRYAAECGAHIVYNSHPHVLQPMEYYGESVIFYSLGNFCYGGNRNPSDKDTAVIQVTVARQADGSVKLDGVTAYPCSVSSRSDRNDFRPTLCEPDSPQADRVARKLDGTYRPPVQPSPSPEPTVTPSDTPALTSTPTPAPTSTPTSTPAAVE